MSEKWLDKIDYKTESCLSERYIDGTKPSYIAPVKYVNLYWKIGDRCNADCAMCAYHSNHTIVSHDIDKLVYICEVLYQNHLINTLHITGGEPGLYIDIIGKTVENIRKFDKDVLICTNSNGINLSNYVDMMLDTDMDIVNISRHHYLDDKNNEVFRTNTVAQTDEISKVVEKVYTKFPDMIHLNCVLMRDYIDSLDGIVNYLEYVARMKVLVSAFVNLMTINDFCKSHYIDFLDLENEFLKLPNVSKTRSYRKKDNGCRCCNYLYQSTSKESFGHLISIYNRHVIKRDSSTGTLVYDGEYLRQGFDGKIIF